MFAAGWPYNPATGNAICRNGFRLACAGGKFRRDSDIAENSDLPPSVISL
jgi:hypothetical protein